MGKILPCKALRKNPKEWIWGTITVSSTVTELKSLKQISTSFGEVEIIPGTICLRTSFVDMTGRWIYDNDCFEVRNNNTPSAEKNVFVIKRCLLPSDKLVNVENIPYELHPFSAHTKREARHGLKTDVKYWANFDWEYIGNTLLPTSYLTQRESHI